MIAKLLSPKIHDVVRFSSTESPLVCSTVEFGWSSCMIIGISGWVLMAFSHEYLDSAYRYTGILILDLDLCCHKRCYYALSWTDCCFPSIACHATQCCSTVVYILIKIATQHSSNPHLSCPHFILIATLYENRYMGILQAAWVHWINRPPMIWSAAAIGLLASGSGATAVVVARCSHWLCIVERRACRAARCWAWQWCLLLIWWSVSSGLPIVISIPYWLCRSSPSTLGLCKDVHLICSGVCGGPRIRSLC